VKIALRVILALLVVALGVWLWRYFHPSPQEAIRRRLADVARAASYTEPGGMIARAAKAQKLAGYFAPEVSIVVDLPGQSRHEAASRDEIMRSAIGMRNAFRSFKVQLLDPNITVGGDQKSASVDLTLRVETPGDQYLIVQEIKCTLRQLDGEWIILRVETVKTLNRAPTRRSSETPVLT
jgi:hypothetical protein